MREPRESSPPPSLAGTLLLAHPTLRDPNFRRTVVLMSVHNAEGAMGVVLNRPTGRRLGQLNGEFALGPLAGAPVFSGGPVETGQLLLVVWQTQADGFRLHFGVEPARALQLAAEPGAQVRAFMGYAGWSGGQLEDEMRQRTWVVADVPEDLLEMPADPELWRRVLLDVGEEWRLLADEPEDTSGN